jgi:hypothetical protein
MPRSSIRPEQPFVLTLPQYGPAMAWLAKHDVSPSYIAGLFRIDRNHVSVLIHRANLRARRNDRPPRIESPPFQAILAQPLSVEEEYPVRIRREALKPDEIRARIEEIVDRNRHAYTFLQGVAKLNALRPYLADPKNEELLRLLARLHCHKAWFFTHAGWSRSSIAAATAAYRCAGKLFRRTKGTSGYDELQIIADAALIASNSHLNRFEPEEARRALRVTVAACQSQSQCPNEEYYRQLAVTYLQEPNDKDEDARRSFNQAFAVMREYGRNDDDVSVLLSTRRQANLLKPVNWDDKDGALEVFESVSRRFPEHSNEFNIAVSWTAACGFSTDSASANLKAQELIESRSVHASRFGHRATVVSLLRLAPRLPQTLRSDFVRFAVHQNAFGDY